MRRGALYGAASGSIASAEYRALLLVTAGRRSAILPSMLLQLFLVSPAGVELDPVCAAIQPGKSRLRLRQDHFQADLSRAEV